jgi:ABC-type multidrug transport system permease subunit
MALLAFLCWYYPIGLFRNAEWTNSVHSRGITMLMQLWIFLMYTTTFAHMLIAGVETADIAGGIGNLLMVMMYTFCG